MPLRTVLLLACLLVPTALRPSTLPAQGLSALETRLLSARQVTLDFEVTAEGAASIQVAGRLEWSDGALRVEAEGAFGGRPVELVVETLDPATRYRYGVRGRAVEADAPPELWPAVVVGLTRMGILHNLARLTGGAAPDHAEGGVEEFVQVHGVERDEEGRLAFEIRVGGQESGSATLRLDEGGLPAVRRQSVAFPTGEMRVVERYTRVVVTP